MSDLEAFCWAKCFEHHFVVIVVVMKGGFLGECAFWGLMDGVFCEGW
jgi:hypothetical protein